LNADCPLMGTFSDLKLALGEVRLLEGKADIPAAKTDPNRTLFSRKSLDLGSADHAQLGSTI
jgi:hypothetical protein